MSSRSIVLSSYVNAGNPGNSRHHNAGGHDGPSRHIDRPKFKSVYGVPDKVSDATEEMQKKRERASEQYDLPRPRGERRLHDGVGLRSRGCCQKPDHERDGGDAQEYAGKPVEDRKYRCQLRAVKLDVRRERPLRFGGELDAIGTYLSRDQLLRSIIAFLMCAMALPGFKPLGQVRVQLRIVWQR